MKDIPSVLSGCTLGRTVDSLSRASYQCKCLLTAVFWMYEADMNDVPSTMGRLATYTQIIAALQNGDLVAERS
jgi:hypothetical protein